MTTQIDLPENELNEFDLPRICIVTGKTEGVVFKPVKFSWYPRWVAALVIINLLIAAIVAAILTKRVKGELPFTEEAYKQWKRGQVLFTLSVIAALVAFFAGIIMLAGEKLAVVGLLLMLASFVGPIAIYLTQLKNKGPVVHRIADGTVTLQLPSAAATDAIRRHLFSSNKSARPAQALKSA